MYRFFLLIVLCAFAFASFANAQMLPGAKPVPSYMADSTGTPLLMDFKIGLNGVKDNTPFSVFSQRPLMIFYFGPYCPHCQRSYAGIQQTAKEYEQKGLASIAVSVSSVGKRDILTFIEQQNGTIPFFQDPGEFGKRYGDGYVPRLYLVSPDGKIVRYTSVENENLKEIKADIERLLGIVR